MLKPQKRKFRNAGAFYYCQHPSGDEPVRKRVVLEPDGEPVALWCKIRGKWHLQSVISRHEIPKDITGYKIMPARVAG